MLKPRIVHHLLCFIHWHTVDFIVFLKKYSKIIKDDIFYTQMARKSVRDFAPSKHGRRRNYLCQHANKKIRLRGDISKMNFQLGYANVIRVSETEFRNYTVAAYDDAGGTIDILCHIHGKGTGSRFMDGLRAGDQLYMSIPRGKKFYEGAVSQY